VCGLYLVALNSWNCNEAARLRRWRAFISSLAMFVNRSERRLPRLQRIVEENADLLTQEAAARLFVA
jgi:hypothetical protein